VPFDQSECIDAHTTRSSHTTREALTAIEQRLDDRFVRIHRSTIVNLHHVVVVRPYAAGDQQLELTSGRKVVTGRGYRNALFDRLRL
jgi:two-component system LytT family response regulator